MYCIECGVKLGEAEKKCPLCNTAVYHPNYVDRPGKPLYPSEKMPKKASRSKALNGAMIILFLIPLFVCFTADLQLDGRLEWSGYVAGALMLSYIAFALPMWFQKPNPVIFVPCNFVATALYLLYINIATGGTWFLSFALPITVGLCMITCTVVTLLYYLRKGRLRKYVARNIPDSKLDVVFFEGEEEVILAALALLPDYDEIKLESKSTILAEKDGIVDIYDYYKT